jgi:glycosyltransferase involved in cell wall biosynthesis
MPRVSVVLPVFNGAATIGQTLSSLSDQTFGDFEIVVVDDGSNDDTPQFLQRHVESDARIVVIRTPNRGLVEALNTGLDAAQGEFVARMDADDICHPERLAKQVAYLDRTPKAVVVGSQVLVIDAQGVPVPRQPSLGSHKMKDRCKGFSYFPLAPPTVAHPSAMIRRSSLEEVGRYRRFFAMGSEDRDLWWRLMSVGEIHRIPERLVRYRVHGGNLTAVKRRDILVAALIADLSAVARHFGRGDESLLGDLTSDSGVEILKRYAALLDDCYPVRALVFHRAIRSKVPEFASWIERPEMRREIARHLLRKRNASGQWRLLQAAML